MSTTASHSVKGRALRDGALMAVASTASRFLGFVRTFLMGMVFGGSASIAANAYSAANVLPNSLWLLIGGGTLNAILVPAIVRAMRLPDKGNDYMSRLFTLVLLVSTAITAICTLLVPVLLVVANSKLDPGTMQAATILGYFLMPQIVFSAIYVMFGQILNAHESFGPFTWAPALNNVLAILGSVMFLVLWGAVPDGTHWTWPMIAVLAGSQLAGQAGQAVLVWLWTRKFGLRIHLKWGFRGLGLGNLGRLGMWTLAMMILGQVGVFARRWSTAGAVNTAEQLQTAGHHAERGLYPALAALDWAYVVFMMPQGIIAVALVTSIFPRMSMQATDGEHAGAFQTYSAMNRILFVPMMLCTAISVVLAGPIMWVAVGGTSPDAAGANGLVLSGFMIGLVPFAALYLVNRFFYAYEDARASFLVQIPITLLSVIAVFPILAYVDPKFATAVAAAVSSFGALVAWFMSLWLMRRRLKALGVSPKPGSALHTVSAFVKLAVAAAVSGAAGWGALALIGQFTWSNRLMAIGVCAVISAVITAVFVAVAFLLRVDEIHDARTMIMRKFGRG